MKKIITAIFIFATSWGALTSCQNWLDTAPPTEVREEPMFSSVQGFQSALYGCYIGMINNGLYAENLIYRIPEVLAHQYSLDNLSKNIEFHRYQFNGLYSKPAIDSVWQNAYNVIANANNALKYIDKNREVLDQINYNVIKGELLTIRAFLHFDLMRLFGMSNLAARNDKATRVTIPYVTSLSKNIEIQRSYTETIGLMVSDLTLAMELLEDADPVTNKHPESYYEEVNENRFFDNRKQRFNYFAAKTLLARVYMWEGSRGSLEEALSLASEAITELEGHPHIQWVTSGAATTSDPILTPEHIASLNVLNLWKRTSRFFTLTPAINNATEHFYLTASLAQEIYEYPTTDYRYTSMLHEYASQTKGNIFTPEKFIMSPEFNDITGTVKANNFNIPLMRLPELYYMAAECHARLDNVPGALARLNTVRVNRGLSELEGITDPEIMMTEIRKEYRKEFLAEGQMFYFYKRNGITDIPDYYEEADDSVYMLPYPDIELQLGLVQ